MAVNRKFTRIPKVPDLVAAGVPTEVIPTYCALADYSNNKTGLCWPKMETLAKLLNRSLRTIQRHLHLLKDLGLIEFVERRRHKGRFSSYTYRILATFTTGHGKRMDRSRSNRRRTKPVPTPPKSPSKEVLDQYLWFFGEDSGTEEQETERWRDYEWFFG